MDLQAQFYIPAGSICLAREETGLSEKLWDSIPLISWNRFRQETGLGDNHQGSWPDEYLDAEVQGQILKSSHLRCISPLFRARWVDLELRLKPLTSSGGSAVRPKEATVRVYLLPDDLLRRTINRSDAGLRKLRRSLLQNLDFSSHAWKGEEVSSPTRCNALLNPSPDSSDEPLSLLQVFNRIPSPRPDPDSVAEIPHRDAIYSLLRNNIRGLMTDLHSYQRRSAAVMLQKEVQPERVFDPRLTPAEDQSGKIYYLDPVAGSILIEPRTYDGVSGGILAEEMGSGKTVICLALILATLHLPAAPPELYRGGELPVRREIASLADMAASCASRNAVPWRPYFDSSTSRLGYDSDRIMEALQRNPGYYLRPAFQPRRLSCRSNDATGKRQTKVYLSSASLIVVPDNLMAQWNVEISKHTVGLKVLVLAGSKPLPTVEAILKLDIVLFSHTRFEGLVKQEEDIGQSSLASVQFKRCIVDEGHRLGNSSMWRKCDLLIGLDSLNVCSRWIVTGTPSQGLFGVDESQPSQRESCFSIRDGYFSNISSKMETKDLRRLGAIASLYLKARPWANLAVEREDTLADWNTYLLLPQHSTRGQGRWDCLKTTLNSLIVRHQLSEVGNLLPPVDEKIIMLDGSFQDRLSLNIFFMMIIFNSVLSQRTDVDYFFHPRQKKNLLQIVSNLKQTSFYGSSFFSAEEIATSVKTAEAFLRERRVPIGHKDEVLLREAIHLGKRAVKNRLRGLSHRYQELPVMVEQFPGGAGKSWSLDAEGTHAVCTSASLLLRLQRLLYSASDKPEQLKALLKGRLVHEGLMERARILASLKPVKAATPRHKPVAMQSEALAGITAFGDDSPRRNRGHPSQPTWEEKNAGVLPAPFLSAQVTSTISAKMSYLLDSICDHQEREKMIVFYENENVAWHLASMLEVVSTATLRRRRHVRAGTLLTGGRSISPISFMPGNCRRNKEMDTLQSFTKNPESGAL